MKTKKQIIKKILWVSVIILTLLGSFSGFEKGVWPFYMEKSGKTFGINFCLVTKYLPGSSHSGINISFWTTQQENSKINGISFSIINMDKHSYEEENSALEPKTKELAIVNGIEIGILVNLPGNSMDYISNKLPRDGIKRINGFQIALIVNMSNLKGVQIGIFNRHCRLNHKNQNSILINIANGDK